MVTKDTGNNLFKNVDAEKVIKLQCICSERGGGGEGRYNLLLEIVQNINSCCSH